MPIHGVRFYPPPVFEDVFDNVSDLSHPSFQVIFNMYQCTNWRISHLTDLNLADEDLPGSLPDLGQVPGAHVELLPDAELPAHQVHHVHQTCQTLGKDSRNTKNAKIQLLTY